MKVLFFAATFHRNQHLVLDALIDKGVDAHFFYFLNDPTQLDHDSAEKFPVSVIYRVSEPILYPVFALFLLFRGKKPKITKVRNRFLFPSVRFLYCLFSAHGEKIVIAMDVPHHGSRFYTFIIRLVAKFCKVPFVLRIEQGMTECSKKFDDVVISPVSEQSVFSSEYVPRIGRAWHVPYPVRKPLGYFSSANESNILPASLDEASFLILTTGRFGTVSKRHDMLLLAFARLPAGIREKCNLLICGHGNKESLMYPILQQKIIEYKVQDRVNLSLNLSKKDMDMLYEKTDLFVLSSDRESYSVSVLEALAAGVPVVASDGNGSSDLLKDGYNGFLFSAGDQKSLDDTLNRAISDIETSANEFAYNALSTYENYLTPEAYLSRLESVAASEFNIRMFD